MWTYLYTAWNTETSFKVRGVRRDGIRMTPHHENRAMTDSLDIMVNMDMTVIMDMTEDLSRIWNLSLGVAT